MSTTRKTAPARLVALLTLALQIPEFSPQAETVKDRAGAVRDDRASMSQNDRWIYNDWRQGFEEAKRTGKPLLVVLRCVPCLACAGIDASILTDPALSPMLEKFVCVRVINANALDLSLFQFDYDLSFSTVFFNGDGSVYGRYGSWTHQKDAANKTTAGYKSALESVLAIHREYPGNKATLKGKQGAAMPVKDPLELPELAGKYKRDLDWDGKVVQSCVHCHQVSDAIRSTYRDRKETIPREWIYPMPTPEVLGLKLAADSAARIESVAKDSIGAKAGLQANDEIVALEGQPIVSIADVAWVLHHTTDAGNLQARVNRGGSEKSVTIPLPAGWKMHSDISRRVGTWPMRAMATGGILLKDLTDEERAARGIGKEHLALRAEHVGEYGNHAAAKKAGFKKEDIIIEINGDSRRWTESQLIGLLLEGHRPGEKLKTTVLRGTERLSLTLPMQ